MHTINDNSGHFKDLLLFPDYASSGLWCSCGLGIGDPKEELNISYQVIDLVQFWNDYWDMVSTMMSEKQNKNNSDSIAYFERRIINIGRILREQISEFIPCELVEDRCKLNITDFDYE